MAQYTACSLLHDLSIAIKFSVLNALITTICLFAFSHIADDKHLCFSVVAFVLMSRDITPGQCLNFYIGPTINLSLVPSPSLPNSIWSKLDTLLSSLECLYSQTPHSSFPWWLIKHKNYSTMPAESLHLRHD